MTSSIEVKLQRCSTTNETVSTALNCLIHSGADTFPFATPSNSLHLAIKFVFSLI